MGLDMYLSVKKYIPKYDWAKMSVSDDLNDLIENADYKILKSLLAPNLIDDDSSAGFRVEIPAGYWRKANAIHKFFVDTCADGVDNCQETYVSVENLQELLGRCKEVLENRDLASEILPSQSGFFFGSTEYDEWYFDDLERTVKTLEKIIPQIESHSDWDIYYCASW